MRGAFVGRPSPDLLRLLGYLLGAPVDDTLSFLDELSTTCPWLRRSFSETKSLPLEAWQAEHTRLFLSSFPHIICPPFASVYQHGYFNGPIVEELCAFYEAIGLEAAVGFEDFLGTMFECAAQLIEQHNDDGFSTFWRNYLTTWVPHFAIDLRTGTQMQLYYDIGEQIRVLFSCYSVTK